MKYYMGIDAGGSKTYAVIADADGRIAGFGKGGNGNHQVNREQAEQSLRRAVREALAQAELKAEQIEFAWFGMAGADREPDYRILRPIVGGLQLPRTAISCDTTIALRAGTQQPYGVVLICGTGVNCSGTNRGGETFQCGGFGYQFGDYGGGQDLSLEVFRSVIRAWDGREEETLLSDMLIHHLGYGSVAAMRDDYLDHSRPLPATIAQLLFEALEQGDGVARRLLERQGDELGRMAAATIDWLKMNEEQFDIVLAGSLLTRGDKQGVLYGAIENRSKAAAPRSSLKVLKTEPFVGAVILAMESEGAAVPANVVNSLTKSGLDYIQNIR